APPAQAGPSHGNRLSRGRAPRAGRPTPPLLGPGASAAGREPLPLTSRPTRRNAQPKTRSSPHYPVHAATLGRRGSAVYRATAMSFGGPGPRRFRPSRAGLGGDNRPKIG